MRPSAVVAVAAVVIVVAGVSAGCGADGSGDLDRIDGPAQVDPDYRPLEEGTEPGATDG